MLRGILGTNGARAARAHWALFGLFALPYVWLVLSIEYLPMQDLPGHVELAFLFDRVLSGDPAYVPFYRIAPQPWPNSLSTLSLGLLGKVVGFTAAVKLVLGLYLLAWPLALGLLATRLGRSPWVAVLAIPTGLDFAWAMGFLSYLIAKPLAVAAVAVAIGFAKRPSPLQGFGVLALLFVTYLGHAIAWMVAMAGAALAIVVFSGSWRRVTNLWPIFGACALPWRYLRARAAGAGGPWTLYSFDEGFESAWLHLGDLGSSNGEEWAYFLGFAMWVLVLVATQHRSEPPSGSDDAKRGSLFLWVSAFSLFLIYGWGPAHLPEVAIVCVRVLVFAWVLVLLLPLRIPHGWQGVLVMVTMVLAVGVHAGATHAQYRRFNRIEMSGFKELLAQVPAGRTLAVHYLRAESPFAGPRGMWHWPKLHTLRGAGARTNDTFAWRATSYVTLTEQARATETFEGKPGLFPPALARWDYLLVHGGRLPTVAAGASGVAQALGTASEWHLFEIKK